MSYGYLSLLPPLVAIAFALVTKRVLLPLGAGIFVGAGLLTYSADDSLWWMGVLPRFVVSIHDSVWNADHLMVLAFTVLLGATVGVIESTGTMRAAIGRLAGRVKDSRGGQTMIAILGLVIFFDDYANTLLVGGTMRSTADRYKISRAKLAYLVDSTAAPVAGLALVSTWVATEISYLQSGIDASSMKGEINAFEFFIESVPYRFYPLFALVLVFIIARTGRDFGPMRKAELECLNREEKQPENEPFDEGDVEPELSYPVVAAVIPIAVCLIAVFAVLIVTGRQSMPAESIAAESITAESISGGWLRQAGTWIGTGDSYLALVVGGGCGLLVAIAVGLLAKCPGKKIGTGIIAGSKQMMPAMFVLWLAWALSAMTDDLDTGGYLASVLTDRLDVRWLPSCVFLLGGAIAFSTGTSWGTMAILTPIAVSLVLDMQGAADGNSAIALATFGSVLAGAIFGDHCSPISDTTVLSSNACGCDHVTHVTTQMPYAVLAGGVCLVAGTIPVSFGVPVWVCLLLGVGLLIGAVRWLGQRSDGNGPF